LDQWGALDLNAFTAAFGKELAPKSVKVSAAARGCAATDINGHRGRRTVRRPAETVVRPAILAADGPTAG
jgi:short-subunit dehydrogenase